MRTHPFKAILCMAVLIVMSMPMGVSLAQTAPPKTDSTSKSTASAAVATKAPAANKKLTTAADRLDLETTVVSGNSELPKVLYIVPWKKSEIGELPAQPFNTLLDEVLAPVDRDVFKREVKYYHAVNAGRELGGTGAEQSGKH